MEVGVVFRETKRYDPVKIKPMESRGFNKFNSFFFGKSAVRRKPKHERLLAGSTDGGERSHGQRWTTGNRLLMKPRVESQAEYRCRHYLLLTIQWKLDFFRVVSNLRALGLAFLLVGSSASDCDSSNLVVIILGVVVQGGIGNVRIFLIPFSSRFRLWFRFSRLTLTAPT